ncbi:MAG: site-specific DNA-methyltransferase, partial [Anaerolineales bacterium]
RVDAVDDEWDQFANFAVYDEFTRAWLTGCRRVLKEDGALWVIGTYHNIHRVGRILQDLGFWFLNDVIWIKTNPMPNFRGVRLTNAHETLLWVVKEEGASYTFNYHAMKRFNDGKQLRSDWFLPVCSGKERLKMDGKKVHSTQKPEALLYRVILASSDPGDLILDPFFGTGTTGVVAKRLHRRWIGIEQDQDYAEAARERIEAVEPEPYDEELFEVRDRRRRLPRVPFAQLLELSLIRPGQSLFFNATREAEARVKPDGKLVLDDFEGSIHQAAKHLSNGKPTNGWDHWFFENTEGDLKLIDELRQVARKELGLL